MKDRFEDIKNEIPTTLLKYTDSGYVQVIYYQVKVNLFKAYVRVYNMFNHRKTKNFKDYLIEEVRG